MTAELQILYPLKILATERLQMVKIPTNPMCSLPDLTRKPFPLCPLNFFPADCQKEAAKFWFRRTLRQTAV